MNTFEKIYAAFSAAIFLLMGIWCLFTHPNSDGLFLFVICLIFGLGFLGSLINNSLIQMPFILIQKAVLYIITIGTILVTLEFLFDKLISLFK